MRKIRNSFRVTRSLLHVLRFVFIFWPFLVALYVAYLAANAFVLHDPVKVYSPFADYWNQNRFDADAFKAKPVITTVASYPPYYGPTLSRRPYDPNSPALRIFVFGESTTEGVPYMNGTYGWPDQLMKMIEDERLLGNKKVELFSFAHSAIQLDWQLPLGSSAPFFRATRPRVVILHNVINSFLNSIRLTYFLPDVFGFRRLQSTDNQKDLARYAVLLDDVYRGVAAAGALLVVIIPELDDNYYEANPLAAWQAVAAAAAKKHGAVIVDQRQINETARDAILYFEQVHPNAIGYRLLARAVFDAIKENLRRDREGNKRLPASE
jgi:lysophospholipase L1-like esterase